MFVGNLSIKVGRGRFGKIVGLDEVRERNERGDKFVEWCVEIEQFILNTWVRHHPCILWTWRSSGEHYQNHLDFIAFNKRFRNIINNLKTYPGAD